ncbi:SRPBCC domain-containing protein [Streptomyces sp. NPDC047860]|uniref:SRPBCC domain-containing protein n=1 Tax=Streptomyces sp. NPDC047860 TaxID=3155743 RepID=UPI0033F35FBD
MEHEVFVPVEEERLREVLDDPARVARAVPGLQHDAGADPVAGRLKVRVGSHSVTYRGAVRVSSRNDGSYALDGDATEARGSGTVKLALRLRLRPADAGTTVRITGTATADGRVKELPPDAVTVAVTRLLNRFAENLGSVAAESPGPAEDQEPESPELLSTGDFEPPATTDFETTPDADDAPPPPPTPDADDESRSDFDTEIPHDEEDDEDSVAEAAHARRTMIGRSAEEVDHAPPRGRYAPVPAPQTISSSPSLRWAAPAAALAVASAVVAIRALRRRR